MVISGLQNPAPSEEAPVRLWALVAEDDSNTRRMIRVILGQEGFDVREAVDGVDAIEEVRNGDYALLVLDLKMPNIDGAGVMAYVRRHRPDALKNIIVTSALPPADMQRLCDPDVCSILPKPFDIEDLRRLARKCAADSANPTSC